MLKLNLVPEKTKQEMNLKRAFTIIKGISYTFIFFIIIISALFVSAKTFLIENLNEDSSDEKLTNEQKQSQEQIKEIRSINTKIRSIASIQNNFHSYTDITQNFLDQIPDNISLNRYRVTIHPSPMIEIIGVALTRDDLLDMKNNLENLDFVKNIDFPLQNILTKVNVRFNIKIEIDLKKMEEAKEKTKNFQATSTTEIILETKKTSANNIQEE